MCVFFPDSVFYLISLDRLFPAAAVKTSRCSFKSQREVGGALSGCLFLSANQRAPLGFGERHRECAGSRVRSAAVMLTTCKSFKLRSLSTDRKYGVAAKSLKELLSKSCLRLQVLRSWQGWLQINPLGCGAL